MHTFIKWLEDDYHVGVWLIAREGGYHKFQKVLNVKSLDSAIYMVNILNGGNGEFDHESLPDMEVP